MASLLDKFSTRGQLRCDVTVKEPDDKNPAFIVTCEFQDGKAFESMLEESRERNRRGTLEVNDDKFRRRLLTQSVRGWQGLTAGNLLRILPMRAVRLDPQEFIKACPDGMIPFDIETALDLYRESLAKDFWDPLIEGLEREAERLAKTRIEEVETARKNSGNSYASSSA